MIPDAAGDRVFERFVRLQDDDSGGCGLGLAIVGEVAKSHGGAIASGWRESLNCFGSSARLS